MTNQLPHAALAGGRPSRPPTDGLPVPQRYGSLCTIWLAMGMTVLDGVVMNLVPVITRGLHVDATSAVWAINAYQIAIVMLLLPLAAAGEIVGYRKVYLCGVALFASASLGCALAVAAAELQTPDMAILTTPSDRREAAASRPAN